MGVVVSELPPGSPPLAHHFPLRNRIISGLVRAVVVIEAGERSGSLITARMALEQGRDVLAVPGSVATGCYRGSHALIKDGARLVETVEDILEELEWSRPAGLAPAGSAVGIPNSFITNGLEGKMASGEPYSLDDLAAGTGRPAAVLLAELATLEWPAGSPGWPGEISSGLTNLLRIEVRKDTRHMAKALVIVESPAKAKTINKYLGRDYKVDGLDGTRPRPAQEQARRGRRRRLRARIRRHPGPREGDQGAQGGGQEPPTRSSSRPTRTAKARRSAGIWPRSWARKKKKVRRLMFNEITKKAILEAIKHPGEIDMRMVDAQQARRVLDRLVGYKISPILWDKVRRGLSAGRVQSVALKLICDREREIEAFVARGVLAHHGAARRRAAA